MFRSIFFFELTYQLKYPLFYGLAVVFFLFTFGAEVSDSFQLGGSIGNEYRNAPIVILRWLAMMSIMGMFVVTAFVASSVQRDFARRTCELIFSRPVGKFSYLMGRFGGSMVLSLMVVLASFFGIIVGSFMPWLDPGRLGPFRIAPYLYGLFVIILPNLFLMGAMLFTLAGITRSMLASFMGTIGILVAWAYATFAMEGLENQTAAALTDPFGFVPMNLATKYWTIIEKNAALPPLDGLFLVNRLVWIGVGVVILVLGYRSFRLEAVRSRKLFRRKKEGTEEREPGVPARVEKGGMDLPRPERTFSSLTSLRQFIHMTRIETTAVIRSIPFIVILVFSLLNVFGGVVVSGELFGTSVYPVTHIMIENMHSSYLFILIIIITFYSGEMVWREQSIRLNEVTDSLPVPNWAYPASKMSALVLVVVVFVLAGMLSTMGYQIYRGYTDFEISLYVKGLAMALVPYVLICILACTLQVLANNKFLGYLLMIMYLVSESIFEVLGMEHYMFQYARSPRTPYSDMNGYGHFIEPFLWYNSYWSFLALVLFALSIVFWVRGTESGWRKRLRLATIRFRKPVRGLAAAGLLGFLTTGAFIYYNTVVLNEYVSSDTKTERKALYEKNYRRYKDVVLPRITAVTADVDIYPEERRVEIGGQYTMVNTSSSSIDTLHLTIPTRVKVNGLAFRGHVPVLADSVLGYYIYEFAEPLAPGDSMLFGFDLTAANPGFVNNGSNTRIVHNGTFIDNMDYFPSLGYNEFDQLEDRNERRKHGLLPVQRMNPIDDEQARQNTYFTGSAERVSFEATVSTDNDQIAIVPGNLEREWTEGERRYFTYRMDVPMHNFFSFLSGRYTVRRDRWNDVAIEVYYHEPHDFNVDRMIEAVRKSLDYFTANFGPYQHRQVRIVEFPGYEKFAQSFAGTIPYSESAGFIAELRNEEDIDYVFYITAHEVAHQWWAHQVIGANVQGATLLSESLAQYSALMVMEKEYGKDQMRRFLKYELDKYLRDRGAELVEELPLMLVENQPYIHYQKGSLVMYALRDYIGEERLNGALRRYRDAVAYQDPPYTTSVEFLENIRSVTPDSLTYVLEDMFENITLYMNRVEEATWRQREDGRYEVDLTVASKKLRADGRGVETEIPVNDLIDIAVFGEEHVNGQKRETVLYFEKHRIDEEEETFELIVEEVPVRAGIDPYNKLVDRDSEDNVMSVSHES